MSETLPVKSVSSKVKRSEQWYGRVPACVLLNTTISSDAVRVYGLLALSVYQGNIARVGMRQLGKTIGKSAATAMRRLKELVDAGYLKASTGKSGQRACYELTSPVFAQKQRAGVQEVISSPSGGRRLASVRKSA